MSLFYNKNAFVVDFLQNSILPSFYVNIANASTRNVYCHVERVAQFRSEKSLANQWPFREI